MKVKLVTRKVYSIMINDVVVDTFEQTDSWEGMKKLTNDDGETIIVSSEPTLSGFFSRLFEEETQSIEVDVVKASPSLINEINNCMVRKSPPTSEFPDVPKREF